MLSRASKGKVYLSGLLLIASIFCICCACSADDAPSALGNSWVTASDADTPADNYIFTGAASNSIPIVVAPGRVGVEPKLSLNYSSQQGDGWIGIGWSLDAGSIQRNTQG